MHEANRARQTLEFAVEAISDGGGPELAIIRARLDREVARFASDQPGEALSSSVEPALRATLDNFLELALYHRLLALLAARAGDTGASTIHLANARRYGAIYGKRLRRAQGAEARARLDDFLGAQFGLMLK